MDTNSFITPKNGPYSFDIAPGFWTFLEQKASEGIIASSTLVYDELINHSEDDLIQWAKERKDSGLFVAPGVIVQTVFREIADFVQKNYEPHQAAEFLHGADPWLIAHPKAYGGKIVTFEARVPINSKKVKIPNVADQFGVECINIYELLRDLGASFS